MSGKASEIELMASNVKRTTLVAEAGLADIEQATGNTNTSSGSGVSYHVEMTAKGNKLFLDIITELSNLSNGTATAYDKVDWEKVTKVIETMQYEDLRQLYSKSRKDDISSLFNKKSTFLRVIKSRLEKFACNTVERVESTPTGGSPPKPESSPKADRRTSNKRSQIVSSEQPQKPKQLQNQNDTIIVAGKVINWLTNHQFPHLYKCEHKMEQGSPHRCKVCPKRDVFFWALLKNKIGLARVVWKKIITSNHITSALTASLMLKSMAREIQKCDQPEKSEDHRKFTSEAKWYEDQAKKILEECSVDDFSTAVALFLSASEDWGDMTMCTIALSGKHVTFLDQKCCRYALKITWNSPIKQIKKKYKEILKSKLQDTTNDNNKNATKRVVLATKMLERDACEIVPVNVETDPEEWSINNESYTGNEDDSDDEEDTGICLKICVVLTLVFLWPILLMYAIYLLFKYIYTYKLLSPLFKFMLYMLSYATFIALFIYFLLFDLKPDRLSIYEYLVWCWIFSMWLEEVRQIFDSDGSNLWLKVVAYYANSWNIYDLVGFLFSLAAVIMRLTIPESQFYWVTMIYVVCLVMFILRLLQYFSVSEYFGPKIGILIRMFKDTIGYILMFGLFLITYGLASQILLYPNTSATYHAYIKHIVYNPYFTLFGQFDWLQSQMFNCTYNDTLVDVEADIPKCSWLANILSAVYAFLVCIMLINLLIATYNATYESAADNASALWLFYRIDIITEYIRKPMLPPPLNVFGLIFILIQISCGWFKRGDDLKLKFKDEKIYDYLMELENKTFESILEEEEEAKKLDKAFLEGFEKMKKDILDTILQRLPK